MRDLTLKAIAAIFRKFATKIEEQTCDIDKDTLIDIANKLIHIKLNAEQMCNYLHVSRATLNRMVIDGRIPKPHKTAGDDKYWYQDEVDEYIYNYKKKYNLL